MLNEGYKNAWNGWSEFISIQLKWNMRDWETDRLTDVHLRLRFGLIEINGNPSLLITKREPNLNSDGNGKHTYL